MDGSSNYAHLPLGWNTPHHDEQNRERISTTEFKVPPENLKALSLQRSYTASPRSSSKPSSTQPLKCSRSYSPRNAVENTGVTQVALNTLNPSPSQQYLKEPEKPHLDLALTDEGSPQTQKSLTPECLSDISSTSSSTRHSPGDYMHTPKKTPHPQAAFKHFSFQLSAQLWNQLKEETHALFKANQVLYVPSSIETHRFKEIGSPQTSAVVINGKFLHANFIKIQNGPLLIAAQYPHENNAARELFWRCAFLHGSIIDLSQSNEPEVTPYYPLGEGESKHYGSMHITCKTIGLLHQNMPDIFHIFYDVTDYTQTTPQTKQISRTHYCGWKDHTHTSLDRLSLLVDLIEENPFEQQIIHCRAGVGRTGTLITACNLKKRILNGSVTRENLNSSIVTITANLRLMRGPFFVQKPEQLYQLVEYGLRVLQELEEGRLNSLNQPSKSEDQPVESFSTTDLTDEDQPS